MTLHPIASRTRLALALFAVAAAPALASAQAVSVSGMLATSNHRLLAGSLVGASAGTLVPVREERGVDMYLPFSDQLTLRRVQLGLAWRGAGSRR